MRFKVLVIAVIWNATSPKFRRCVLTFKRSMLPPSTLRMEAAGLSKKMATTYETAWCSHIVRGSFNRTDTLSGTNRSLPQLVQSSSQEPLQSQTLLNQYYGQIHSRHDDWSLERHEIQQSLETPSIHYRPHGQFSPILNTQASMYNDTSANEWPC